MDWNNLLDIGEKIAGIIAVIVGGLWVYSNSFRGRTFIPRLQIDLSGEVFRNEEIQYLLIRMQVKNVGSSIVKLRKEGSGVKIDSLYADSEAQKARELYKGDTTAFEILEETLKNEGVIEPGTAINEEKLIVVPMDRYNAYKIHLKVYAHGGSIFWLIKLPDRHWRAIAFATNRRGTL